MRGVDEDFESDFVVSGPGVSLVIADGHPLIRAGIKEVLAADGLYDLVASTQTGDETLQAMRRFQPEVALINAGISAPGAMRILHEAKVQLWASRICLLTEGRIPPDLVDLEKAGGVILIDGRRPEDLRTRLRAIAIDLLATRATRQSPVDTTSTADRLSRRLTLRQNQIVAMLKVGSSNKEIANILGLTEGTIKVHLHRIYQRTGVSNRTHLAAQSLARE